MVEQGLRAVYELNGWEIDLTQRELRSRGVSVPIGNRAFEDSGDFGSVGRRAVTKRDLIDRVWPVLAMRLKKTRSSIKYIRHSQGALGADRELLQTVSGRGYHLRGIWTMRPATGTGTSTLPKGKCVGAAISVDQPAAAGFSVDRPHRRGRGNLEACPCRPARHPDRGGGHRQDTARARGRP